jgi:hypothetical protein
MLRDAVNLLVIITAMAGAGCGSIYELYAPPGANVNAPRTGYENPDRYKVSSSEYPQYRANRPFAPPPPREGNWTSRTGMVEILPSDTWIVTHRVGDRLAIYSESYQARQRKFLSGKDSFVGPYLYHLLIDASGRINRGWLVLKNPQVVVADSDRYENMDPALRASEGWPDEPLFEAVQTRH